MATEQIIQFRRQDSSCLNSQKVIFSLRFLRIPIIPHILSFLRNRFFLNKIALKQNNSSVVITLL